MRVALIGLGALGLPLATRLAARGVALAAYDLRPAAVEAHRKTNGADGCAIDDAEVYLSCVTDEAAATGLFFGAGGWAESLPAGALVIDHTTTSPSFARRAAAALAARGVAFVDAPLSGGVGGARAGTLLAMLGGRADDCARAAPVLDAYCARQVRFGEAGCGQAAKLANQLCIAGTLAGLDAAAGFARLAGLDVGVLLEALAAGSAHSAQMDQHRALLSGRDASLRERFGWIAKDLELACAAAGQPAGAPALAAWMLKAMEAEPA